VYVEILATSNHRIETVAVTSTVHIVVGELMHVNGNVDVKG
jgi:hypothetical protein